MNHQNTIPKEIVEALINAYCLYIFAKRHDAFLTMGDAHWVYADSLMNALCKVFGLDPLDTDYSTLEKAIYQYGASDVTDFDVQKGAK